MYNHTPVMAGMPFEKRRRFARPCPAIHVSFEACCAGKGVDARVKPGHDDLTINARLNF
jgi:hypothetical protein